MQQRNFYFTWKEKVKFGDPFTRKCSISVKQTDSLGRDAKTAMNIFCSAYGNLKENDIISIQEYNEKGLVGEPIVPKEESSIIPIKK